MVTKCILMTLVVVSALGKSVYATSLFECEYRFYASDLLKIETTDFQLKFVLDDNGEAFVIGNAGAVKVMPITSELGISFIEITPAGSVQTTAIDWNGASSHSRNTLMDGGLVPAQYYGKCILK